MVDPTCPWTIQPQSELEIAPVSLQLCYVIQTLSSKLEVEKNIEPPVMGGPEIKSLSPLKHSAYMRKGSSVMRSREYSPVVRAMNSHETRILNSLIGKYSIEEKSAATKREKEMKSLMSFQKQVKQRLRNFDENEFKSKLYNNQPESEDTVPNLPVINLYPGNCRSSTTLGFQCYRQLYARGLRNLASAEGFIVDRNSNAVSRQSDGFYPAPSRLSDFGSRQSSRMFAASRLSYLSENMMDTMALAGRILVKDTSKEQVTHEFQLPRESRTYRALRDLYEIICVRDKTEKIRENHMNSLKLNEEKCAHALESKVRQLCTELIFQRRK